MAVQTRALQGDRKTNKNTSPEANCALHGEGTRQKPWPAVSLTHLDRELPGQNRPDCVTQAGQEAARSTKRRLGRSGSLCARQVEKPVGTESGVDKAR